MGQLAVWCQNNNLLFTTAKTMELIIVFRKNKNNIELLIINRDCVERVSDFCFLGVREDLTWGTHTAELVKKTQKRLYFLRVLRKNNISDKLLVSLYHCTVESILSYCLCAWFSSCTVTLEERAPVGRCPLPSLEELHSSHCLRNTKRIFQVPSHPGHRLFECLASGRHFRSIKAKTNRTDSEAVSTCQP